MRISKNLIGLAAIGILVTGCGSSSDDDSARTSGSTGSAGTAPSEEAKAPEPGADLAVPVTGPQADVVASSSDPKLKVLPKPANGASFTEKVEHKLQEDLLRRLKVPGKTSANCPDGRALSVSASLASTTARNETRIAQKTATRIPATSPPDTVHRFSARRSAPRAVSVGAAGCRARARSSSHEPIAPRISSPTAFPAGRAEVVRRDCTESFQASTLRVSCDACRTPARIPMIPTPVPWRCPAPSRPN
ncbi:hypothetical protein SBADM41S_01371 [Streptomyces badius]